MTEARATSKIGDSHVTLATWIHLLDRRGIRPKEPALLAACDALAAGGEDADWDALGSALVEALRARLGPGEDDGQVIDALRAIYGAEHLSTVAGTSREDRLVQTRAYEFRVGLPWLARVVDRFPDGRILAHWVIVERVTDTVTCMDPYPWDDVDEEYQAPVVDFMVKWELAGTAIVRWTA
jgi:hypothetical protein